MKYILIVPDGMADDPLPELDGKTPMEAAQKPHMNRLASEGIVGIVDVTPPGMYPGSDSANMALLGYDPLQYYTGRGAVEAAAMGIDMEEKDVAFRCSLVSTDGEKMLDYSAGHITTEEARPLIELAGKKLCTKQMRLFPGVGYRHILLWHDGPVEVTTYPPHEYRNSLLLDIMPQGENESQIRQFIWDSIDLLDKHPFNVRRRDEGKPPANTLWPWSQGRSPQMPSFFQKRGLTGAVISAVDVVKGLGKLTGLDVINVPGATGYYDTDYEGKARAGLKTLESHDFLWIHIEATDEAGHAADIEQKIRAIEQIDTLVVNVLEQGLRGVDDWRMLIVPDHATPITTQGHKAMPVPYLLYDSRGRKGKVNAPYDERAAMEKVPHIQDGYRLIDELLKK
jgi:2,3-bisphosphoglycerate-independent phosphoglycerate mutase